MADQHTREISPIPEVIQPVLQQEQRLHRQVQESLQTSPHPDVATHPTTPATLEDLQGILNPALTRVSEESIPQITDTTKVVSPPKAQGGVVEDDNNLIGQTVVEPIRRAVLGGGLSRLNLAQKWLRLKRQKAGEDPQQDQELKKAA